jgi:DNA-binding SARP family transcriptional activator
MALELATHVWADYVNVIVAGPLALHANLEGIRRTDSIEEAIKDISAEALATRSALADGRFSSTLRARLVDGTSEGWVPTVLFCTSSQAKHLPDIPPNAGVAVVVLGPIESATRVIDVRPDELIVSPPGIHMDGIAFSSNEVQALDNLLAATQEPASSAPIPDAIDLRDEPSSEYEDADVKVDVLGTVHVRGSESEIDRNRASELVAYLALHPKGVSTHRLKTAIWPGRTPTQSSFNSTVSYARTRLGKAPDGSHHLPVVIDGTNYRVGATVQSDAEALRQYVSAAEFATPANAVELLRSALSLVRGLPFAETAGGYEWAHAEGIITELTSLIADASHRLATLALDAGDASLARWAANQGLLASPGYEVLYRDLMLAFALEGNRSGIETSMQELRRVLDVDEDHDQLQTETRELYEELVGSGAKAIRR